MVNHSKFIVNWQIRLSQIEILTAGQNGKRRQNSCLREDRRSEVVDNEEATVWVYMIKSVCRIHDTAITHHNLTLVSPVIMPYNII